VVELHQIRKKHQEQREKLVHQVLDLTLTFAFQIPKNTVVEVDIVEDIVVEEDTVVDIVVVGDIVEDIAVVAVEDIAVVVVEDIVVVVVGIVLVDRNFLRRDSF